MKTEIIRFFLNTFHSSRDAGLEKDAINPRGNKAKIPAGINHNNPVQIDIKTNADLSKSSDMYLKKTNRDIAIVNEANIPPSTVRC